MLLQTSKRPQLSSRSLGRCPWVCGCSAMQEVSALNSWNISSVSDRRCLDVGTGIKRQRTVSMRYLCDFLIAVQSKWTGTPKFCSPTPLQRVVYFTCFSFACHSSHFFPQSFVFFFIKHPIKGWAVTIVYTWGNKAQKWAVIYAG